MRLARRQRNKNEYGGEDNAPLRRKSKERGEFKEAEMGGWWKWTGGARKEIMI